MVASAKRPASSYIVPSDKNLISKKCSLSGLPEVIISVPTDLEESILNALQESEVKQTIKAISAAQSPVSKIYIGYDHLYPLPGVNVAEPRDYLDIRFIHTAPVDSTKVQLPWVKGIGEGDNLKEVYHGKILQRKVGKPTAAMKYLDLPTTNLTVEGIENLKRDLLAEAGKLPLLDSMRAKWGYALHLLYSKISPEQVTNAIKDAIKQYAGLATKTVECIPK